MACHFLIPYHTTTQHDITTRNLWCIAHSDHCLILNSADLYTLLWSLFKDNMPYRPSAILLHHTVSYHNSYHTSLHSYYIPHYIPYYIVKEFCFVHTIQSIAVTLYKNANRKSFKITSHHLTSTFLLVDTHIETSWYEFTWIYNNIHEFTWPT